MNLRKDHYRFCRLAFAGGCAQVLSRSLGGGLRRPPPRQRGVRGPLSPRSPLSCPTSPSSGRAPDGYGIAAGGAAGFPVAPPVLPDVPLFWVGAGRIWGGGGSGRGRRVPPTFVWISVRPETSVPDSLRQCDALPAASSEG